MAGQHTLPQSLLADDRRRWIAAGLGCSTAQLVPLQADDQAGQEAGRTFYALSLSSITLAVREDGLRAYVTRLAAESIPREGLIELLKKCGLLEVHLPSLPKAKSSSRNLAGQKWIKVAEGQTAQSPEGEALEYLVPGQAEKVLPASVLRAASLHLQNLLDSPEKPSCAAPSFPVWCALPGDVLARPVAGRDVFGRDIAAGPGGDKGWRVGAHVQRGTDDLYRAECCGYVCLLDDALSVVPPLWIDSEKLHAYLVVLDTWLRPITREMIGQCLDNLGVVQDIRWEKIARLAQRLSIGLEKRGLYLIAAGVPPQHGKDGRLEILAPAPPKDSPVPRPIEVRAYQLVARRWLPTAGKAGRDLEGRPLPARPGNNRPVYAGANVWVERGPAAEEFFAGESGMLKTGNAELAVVELLKLQGDVSFKTGDLNFKGEIFVAGSVKPAFSLEAGEGITVVGGVESGALLQAGGDVVVGEGIEGRRTRVEAGGQVQARFIRQARVVAARDIAVRALVEDAELRAGHCVVHGSNGQGVHVVGGQIWAGKGIDVQVAGNALGARTQLMAGLTPDQEKQLDRLKTRLDNSYAHILRLLRHFYLERLDSRQIRLLIEAASGPRRKLLASYARQLGELVQLYQKMLTEQAQLQSQISAASREAEIRVRQRAFPGVIIHLGGHQRVLKETVGHICFYQEDGQLREKRLG
jgi:uncharacterized protein (DUF342 family)